MLRWLIANGLRGGVGLLAAAVLLGGLYARGEHYRQGRDAARAEAATLRLQLTQYAAALAAARAEAQRQAAAAAAADTAARRARQQSERRVAHWNRAAIPTDCAGAVRWAASQGPRLGQWEDD